MHYKNKIVKITNLLEIVRAIVTCDSSNIIIQTQLQRIRYVDMTAWWALHTCKYNPISNILILSIRCTKKQNNMLIKSFYVSKPSLCI